jgi:hypothetical protein
MILRGAFQGGGDPLWSSVKALLHFDGSNGSTTFTDSKGLHTWSRSGDAIISTAQAQWNQSGYFDGAGDYISSDSHADFALGASDFSIEFWYRPNSSSVTQNIIANGMSWGANCFGFTDKHVGVPTKFTFWSYNLNTSTAVLTSTSVVTTGTWYFIQLVRNGANLYLYINGSQEATANISTSNIDSAASRAMIIGGDAVGSYCNAYIDDFRFTRAVRSAVLPTAPFPNS